MQFKIADGREHFYQWDLNRQVVVLDPTIEEVHFSNKSEKEALVVNVVDGLANVPNILLQQCFNIRVYAVEDDVTLYETVFELIARPKPSNYVYEETEIKSYEYLENKLNEIEEKGFSEETVGNAVEGWLDENLDLSPYALKEELPVNVSELVNDAGYLTEHQDISGKADVDHNHDTVYAFKEHEHKQYLTEHQSLDHLALKEHEHKQYLTQHQSLDHLALKEHKHKEYLTEHQSLAHLALKDHKHAEYLTEHQDLSSYAKKADIPDVSDFITNIPSEYITESELASKDYATETYVDNAVAGIPKVDLSEYAKKEDIPDVSDFISEIPSEYITESELNSKGYLTEHQDLSHKADKVHYHEEYLTEHQSLEDYYTKSEVDEAIENIELPEVDLSNYYTKSETDSKITSQTLAVANTAGYLKNLADTNFTPVPSVGRSQSLYLAPKNKATSSYPKYNTIILGDNTNVTASTSLNTLGSVVVGSNSSCLAALSSGDSKSILIGNSSETHGTNHIMLGHGSTSGYNTDGQIIIGNNIVGTLEDKVHIGFGDESKSLITVDKDNDLIPYNTTPTKDTAVATKAYVDAAIGNIEAPEVNLDNYYTKEETNALIPDVSDFITSIPEEYITESELDAKGYLTSHQSLANYYTKTQVDNKLASYATTTKLNTGLAAKQDKLVSGTNIKTVNGNSILGSGDINIPTGITALYRHNLYINIITSNPTIPVALTIINTSPTKFTYETLHAYVKANGNYIPVSSKYQTMSTSGDFIVLFDGEGNNMYTLNQDKMYVGIDDKVVSI